jgi:hypothetical protein
LRLNTIEARKSTFCKPASAFGVSGIFPAAQNSKIAPLIMNQPAFSGEIIMDGET